MKKTPTSLLLPILVGVVFVSSGAPSRAENILQNSYNTVASEYYPTSSTGPANGVYDGYSGVGATSTRPGTLPNDFSVPSETPTTPQNDLFNNYKARESSAFSTSSSAAIGGACATTCEPRFITIDYRLRSYFNSRTAYEFGTEPENPNQYHPLSRLSFPLNSMWHGLGAAVEQPNFEFHVEWLTPMQGQINGDLNDYDWTDPATSATTDFGLAKERWLESHQIDMNINYRLWETIFGLPLEFWPTAGFRWQRFNIMTYDMLQPESEGIWYADPYSHYGDALSFRQDYYITYLGGQLRWTAKWGELPPMRFTFETEWGYTDAFNIDHHLLREVGRYTKERTYGDTLLVSFTSEWMISKRFSTGVMAQYQQTSTVGSHQWIIESMGTDETWKNGVRVWSEQTSLMLFLRFCI